MRNKESWFKWLVLIWALVMVVWMILEGSLALTVFLGLFTSLLILIASIRKWFAERWPNWKYSVLVWGVLGLLLGIGTVLMTLTLMAVKTGIHAHGPEYSTGEITWVIDQILLWAVSGLIAGGGVGLLVKAVSRS